MGAFEYRQAQEIQQTFARHGVRYLFIGKSGAILLGFPDTTQDADLYVEKSRKNAEALVPAVRDQLLQQGIIAPSGSDERGRPLYAGNWIVRTSVVRQQTFPPGRPVAVEHRYRTSVGISLDTVLRKAVRESKGMEKEFQRYVKDYCIPNELIRAIDGVAGTAKANIAQLQERRISYILTTGANWAGPIKNFRLVVDKGQEDWLTSFCADNVKKISPTAFEVRIKDFTPERDLKILMIRRGG